MNNKCRDASTLKIYIIYMLDNFWKKSKNCKKGTNVISDAISVFNKCKMFSFKELLSFRNMVYFLLFTI